MEENVKARIHDDGEDPADPEKERWVQPVSATASASVAAGVS
jgi:hypothetical protein